MRHSWRAALAAFLLFLTTRESTGQAAGGLKARLDEVAKLQAEEDRRLSGEIAGKVTWEEQRPAFERHWAEVGRVTGEVLDLVRSHPGDPAAFEALRFVIETARSGPGDESYRAMELLLKDHVRDPGMGMVCAKLFAYRHSTVAEALLRAVLEGHPGREDRGYACHSLAWLLKFRAEMIRRVRGGNLGIDHYVFDRFKEPTERLIRESDPEALDREVEALLERQARDFGDVKDWYTPRRTLGAIAEGELTAIRELSEGKVAPEIAGQDHEGKAFALSDHRGKVVVLTFSASWCGPCVGMYPHERELVKKLEGQPFALVGVNADDDVATLKKAIDSGEITWRCWWDGGMDGPITTRWGVYSIPEIYVLDRAGVIRKRNVRGEELEKAVMALLAEGPAGAPAAK